MDIHVLMERLRAAYPGATTALTHQSPFQLLIATILSAQCTDARVNMVTPGLFARFPTPEAMAGASQEELEEIVRSTGFFRMKAKAIRGSSQRIAEAYGGRVPATMEELLSLPGVARKTANVVLGTAYGVAEGVVVDTHVDRLSRRLGFTRGRNAVEVERDLTKLLPREDWIDFAHLLIFHGRAVCLARKPRCPECMLKDLCPSAPYFLEGKIPPWERKRAGVAAPAPKRKRGLAVRGGVVKRGRGGAKTVQPRSVIARGVGRKRSAKAPAQPVRQAGGSRGRARRTTRKRASPSRRGG